MKFGVPKLVSFVLQSIKGKVKTRRVCIEISINSGGSKVVGTPLIGPGIRF